MNQQVNGKYYTIREASTLTGRSVQQLRRWGSNGTIMVSRPGGRKMWVMVRDSDIVFKEIGKEVADGK